MDFSQQSKDSGSQNQSNDFSGAKAASINQEDQKSAANVNGISHIATLIKAASPYFDPDSQRSLHFLAAIYEVMDSIQLFRQRGTVSAFSFSIKNVDIEGMLKGIRPLCNSQELSFVDKFISFFSMRRMIEMYQAMSSMMNAFNPEPSPSWNTTSEPDASWNDNPQPDSSWASNVGASSSWNANQEPQAQWASNPSSMNQEYSGAPYASSYAGNNNYYNETSNFVDDFDYNTNGGVAFRGPLPDYLETEQRYNNQQNIPNEPEAHHEPQQENHASETNNQQMMDMLGSMLTPEQKSTFEAMKMLFDSGLLNMK